MFGKTFREFSDDFIRLIIIKYKKGTEQLSKGNIYMGIAQCVPYISLRSRRRRRFVIHLRHFRPARSDRRRPTDRPRRDHVLETAETRAFATSDVHPKP